MTTNVLQSDSPVPFRGTDRLDAAASFDQQIEELLTVDEVAALFKVPASWIYEHTRSRARKGSDRLPFVKIGKYVRFQPRAVREFLARRSKTP